jgi:6-pyruvoyl-tetrahydropterin synthase
MKIEAQMKKSDLLFAMLRKSSTVLKSHSTTDFDRKFLIDIKYQYSKLQPTLRNMIRIMANEIERFSAQCASDESFTSTLENECEKYGAIVSKFGHPTLVDSITGNEFVVYHTNIMSKDVVLFEGNEHHAFIVAFGCLLRAQERQKELLDEREREKTRMDILSEFR